MARIVLGMGTSPRPCCLARRRSTLVETDQKSSIATRRGRRSLGTSWRRPTRSLPTWSRRTSGRPPECRAHSVARLRQTLAGPGSTRDRDGRRPDESYKEDWPAACGYYARPIRNSNEHEAYSSVPEWYVQSPGFFEVPGRAISVHSKLAVHSSSRDDIGFDLGASKRLPQGEGEGHAIAYVHRRVMER